MLLRDRAMDAGGDVEVIQIFPSECAGRGLQAWNFYATKFRASPRVVANYAATVTKCNP